MITFRVSTQSHAQVLDITPQVHDAVRTGQLQQGTVTVYVPHTTAGVTIQENADPDVVTDVLARLEEMVPWNHPADRHAEGNTAAHVKASMMGASVTLLVDRGQLQLGRWQGVWFCEFDGPRTREVWVSLSPVP